MQNKLNVYIVTYNRASLLERTIKSVLYQTYSDFDLYVLDNASTDNTEEIVAKFSDARVHYIKHQQNVGGYGNILFAHDHCDKKYFVIFHDDDKMHKDMLEKQIMFLEANPDFSMVSCNADLYDIDSNKTIMREKHSDEIKTYQGTQLLEQYIYKQKNLIYPSIMYNNDFMKANNIFPKENVGPCGDVVLYLDIEKCGGKIAVIEEALMDYGVHQNQDSSLNFGTMLISLFKYFNSDDYYKSYLTENIQGQKRFCRWFLEKAIIRCILGKITVDNARIEVKQFSHEVKGNWTDLVVTKILLWIISLSPDGIKKLYLKVRGRDL